MSTRLEKDQIPSDAVYTAASQALTNKSINGVTPTTAGSATTYLNGTGAYATAVAAALSSATTTITVSGATAPTSGQVLTATSSTTANWQTPSGGGGSSYPWTMLVKPSDQLVSASTTVGVSGLTFSVTSGKVYYVRATIVYFTVNGGNFGCNSANTIFATPGYGLSSTRSNNNASFTQQSPAFTAVTSSASNVALYVNLYFIAANSGTFEFSFQQAVSTTLTVKAGSYIEYMEV